MRSLTLAAVLAFVSTTASASTKFLFTQPNASAAPAIAFTSDAVHVGGMTPANRVVLFAVSLANAHGFLQERTGAKVFTTDADGAFRHVSQHRITLRSVWIAVDIETGRYVTASPVVDAYRLLPFPLHLLKRDTDGIIGLLDNDLLSAEMLVVRPRVGAWRLRALEGQSGDADRARNGKLSLLSEQAISVAPGGDPPPRRLRNGDIIAVINPGRMELVILEIGRE